MASDSEEIEYLALRTPPFRPSNTGRQQSSSGDDDDGSSEIFTHEEEGFLVHMSHEDNKTQWNHVDDLDKFFTSVYDYHQRHGFQNMVLMEVLQLLQFAFIVLFVTYLTWCVNYPELFDEVPHKNESHKKTISDITYPVGECSTKISFFTWVLLFLCSLFFVGRSIKMALNFCNYLRTRNFFISALNTETSDLSNMTWHEVQIRLLEVQKEQQICIHKQELTELDIYHRILRFKNYLVAMVNKELLPLKMKLPMIGEHALLTHGMGFNMDILLYWSPWSIFVNSYTMREDYKSHMKRRQLSDQLSSHIALLAVLNLILSPFIFFYQIIYFFFRYAEFVKRSPSFLGSRQWANYGRLYLRHFNELDHELFARLNRAYIPSTMYMKSFTSASLIIIAKYIAFFAGAPAAVLFVLGIMDFNDVTKVEHLFTIASVCGMLATVCSGLIPDENEVFCPERLMMTILAQIHYMPAHWKGKAHTSTVRDEFSMLFQYKIVYILEELLSPIFTPFWLFFCLRPKAIQIVDFFRCFTVEVSGVGDVCSFAQMDIKKHGNHQWAPAAGTSPDDIKVSKSHQGEHGKIELSLMHFTSTNPEWKPPKESINFVTGVKQEVQKDLPALTSIIADPISLPSLGYVNPIPSYYHMGSSQYQSPFYPTGNPPSSPSPGTSGLPGHGSSLTQTLSSSVCPTSSNSLAGARLKGGLSSLDAPVVNNSQHQPTVLTTGRGDGQGMMVSSLVSNTGSFYSTGFNSLSIVDEGQRELLTGNMSLSVLHLYETQHRLRFGGAVGLGVGDASHRASYGGKMISGYQQITRPAAYGSIPQSEPSGMGSIRLQHHTDGKREDDRETHHVSNIPNARGKQQLLSSSAMSTSSDYGPLSMGYRATYDTESDSEPTTIALRSELVQAQHQLSKPSNLAGQMGRPSSDHQQLSRLHTGQTPSVDDNQSLVQEFNFSSRLGGDNADAEPPLHPLAERFQQRMSGLETNDGVGFDGAAQLIQAPQSTSLTNPTVNLLYRSPPVASSIAGAANAPNMSSRPLMPHIEEDMTPEQEIDTTSLQQ